MQNNRQPYSIRPALAEDCTELTKLARLSKAHWGYPAEWLVRWEADLTISPENLENVVAYVAQQDQIIIGFWCRQAVQSEQVTPGWLFIHPAHMGRGVAKALWQAVRQGLIACHIDSFVLEADPNALPFYFSLGAEKIAERPSELISGRSIPILRLKISDIPD